MSDIKAQFSKYTDYKDSGLFWIGDIPSHWEMRRVRTLDPRNETVQTGPFGAQLHASDYVDEGVPLILIRNVDNLWIDDTDIPRVSQEDAERLSMYRLEKGDIVFSRVGSIGKVALCSEREEGWLISGQMLRLRIKNSGLDNQYALYAFSSELILTYVELESVGSTRDSINTSILKSLPIPVPPLLEQNAIAKFLDTQTASINNLLSSLDKLLEKLFEKRLTIVDEILTKGIAKNMVMRNSGVEWFQQLPEHWNIEFARWLFREVDERLSQTGEEELLSVSHITGVTPRSEKNVNMFEANTLEGYKVCQPGDLVINTLWAWMGAMGVAFQEGIVSPAYHVYRPQGDYDPRYIDYLVRLPNFAKEVTRYSKGVWSSRLRLYPDEFFKIVLPVPPIEEQREIVAFLDAETAKLDELSKAVEETIQLLQERRSALVAAAVTGKIRVTE